jgi:hypothetical protein
MRCTLISVFSAAALFGGALAAVSHDLAARQGTGRTLPILKGLSLPTYSSHGS